MKPELVFFPLPAAGHLASAMQFAELLLSRHNQLSIRILILNDGNAGKSYLKSLYTEKATEGIQFTEVSEPPQPLKKKSDNPFIFLCELMHAFKPQVRDLVAELRNSGSSKLVGFVVDMFTTVMIDIADEFELPSYLFYTSGAATLGLWLHTQRLRDVLIEHDGDIPSELELSVPAYKNPLQAKLIPAVMFEKEGFNTCLNISQKITQAKGIMINTYRDMESHALKVLENDPRMPPIYTIGPLINFTGMNPDRKESETIMKWLDNQPYSSVVFLCFGSLGFFDAAEQVEEIAKALENSGSRFLWSLRTAPSKDRKQNPKGFEEILPEGFLHRTAGIGKVIGWAPQVQVLGHPAVGGFVTHCGWNSVLESVWYGVPMAAWPMYAEQQVNASQIVKDIGIAAEIKMDYNIDQKAGNRVIVKADQIENGIRQIMHPESEIKKKVTDLMGKARNAMLKGGSSYASMGNLIEDLVLNQP